MERSKHEWGLRLIARPFSTAKFSDLMIQADVHKPSRGHARKQVYVTFRGTSGDSLRYADARTWQAAYTALLAEVDKVVDEFTPKKKATKKVAKKAAKKR